MKVDVPTGWRATTLGEIGRYLNGRGFKKSEWRDSGRPIIRIQNLTGSSATFNHFQGEIEDRYVARPGDLLVSWAATLGAYFWDGPEGVVNQHIFKVESNIDRRFHKYLLDHKLADLMLHTHGSGMVHITRGRFDSEPVQVPIAIAEQRRIVEILEDHLSRLDAADSDCRAAAARVTALRRSALDRFFSSGSKVPLHELVSDISAGKSFGSASAPAGPDEWGILKVSAMTWGAFDESQNKRVPSERVDPRFEIHPGDLLVSRANTSNYVGASVLVTDVRPRLLLSDKSLRLTPAPDVSAEWLWRALQSPSARRQISALATGTKDSMRNISQSSLRAVCLPKVNPDEQERALIEFAEIESLTARLEVALSETADRSRVLRRAVLGAAFEGRLTGRCTDDETVEEMADSHQEGA